MSNSDKNAIAQYLRDKTGLKIAKIARNLGVSRKNLYEAINGNGSTKNRVEIAKLLNMPPSLIWNSNDKEKQIVDDFHYLNGGKNNERK